MMDRPSSGSVYETRRSLQVFAIHLAGCSRSGAHHTRMIFSDVFALGTTAVLSFRRECWERLSMIMIVFNKRWSNLVYNFEYFTDHFFHPFHVDVLGVRGLYKVMMRG